MLLPFSICITILQFLVFLARIFVKLTSFSYIYPKWKRQYCRFTGHINAEDAKDSQRSQSFYRFETIAIRDRDEIIKDRGILLHFKTSAYSANFSAVSAFICPLPLTYCLFHFEKAEV